MARACTVCVSEHRESIDSRLTCGESSYKLAAEYGVSASAIQRHAKRHLSAALAGMQAAEQAQRRASLLERVEVLVSRAETLYAAAAGEGKASQALAVLKELRGLLELYGKASGELDTRPVTVVNLQTSAEWLELRALLFATLQPWPDARAALSGRLLALEAGPTP